jgi:hypothetical protein
MKPGDEAGTDWRFITLKFLSKKNTLKKEENCFSAIQYQSKSVKVEGRKEPVFISCSFLQAGNNPKPTELEPSLSEENLCSLWTTFELFRDSSRNNGGLLSNMIIFV